MTGPGPSDAYFEERIGTPLGTLVLVTDMRGVPIVVDWEDCPDRLARLMNRACCGPSGPRARTSAVCNRIRDYFDGDVTALDDVVTRPSGTAFQLKVWTALQAIPAGQTRSYGELAGQLGHSGGARAVGAANGANPISVVIPCHRLVGANGALTGYAGGVERKRWLLAHERRNAS